MSGRQIPGDVRASTPPTVQASSQATVRLTDHLPLQSAASLASTGAIPATLIKF